LIEIGLFVVVVEHLLAGGEIVLPIDAIIAEADEGEVLRYFTLLVLQFDVGVIFE
jgi:hypothetical protein